MQLKTLFNLVAKQPGFVFTDISWSMTIKGAQLLAGLRARQGSRGKCAQCMQPGPCYDHVKERRFAFVPLWLIPVWFVYAPRRIQCPEHGLHVEHMPWATGKSPLTVQYAWFLASWAKVLSWKETAKRFGTSWHTVFTAVEHAVDWGKAHRQLDGIKAIGVDELSRAKGQRYFVLVYQIDDHCRRLLWIGRDRTAKTFNGFFNWLGAERCAGLQFVISDMWKAFVNTAAKRANRAVQVLDPFHIAKLCNDAVDKTRRQEAAKLRKEGAEVDLKGTRWLWLKRRSKVRGKRRWWLDELLQANLSTVKAYLLKEDLRHFWRYNSVHHAKYFLAGWIGEAMRSGVEPMAKVARTLQAHTPLLLNYFKAKGMLKMGAVEGFNNKARHALALSYGFRNTEHAEIALFHRLGELPEPNFTHRFA
jgi:transposase